MKYQNWHTIERIFSGSQMGTLSEAHNMTSTSSKASKTFLAWPQMFNIPTSSTSTITIFKKVQKDLPVSIALAELVGWVSLVLNTTIANKSTTEEVRMKVEHEITNLYK